MVAASPSPPPGNLLTPAVSFGLDRRKYGCRRWRDLPGMQPLLNAKCPPRHCSIIKRVNIISAQASFPSWRPGDAPRKYPAIPLRLNCFAAWCLDPGSEA